MDVPVWAAIAAEAATADAVLQAARAKAPTDEAA